MTKRILFLGFALAAFSFAQGKKGGGGNMPDMPMMAPTVNRMDQISDILKLDKDEKKQVKTIMDDAQKEASPVRDQMDKSRLSVAQAVAAGKQEEIDAAVKSYAAAESQMAGIEMNAFAKVYQTLDKEQQTKSPQIFPMFLGIFKGRNWNESTQR
jgi:hypothetical protein